MHRWILYGNVYQRHMNYTPSWNIETKVGGGLMHAFKYFFFLSCSCFLLVLFCFFDSGFYSLTYAQVTTGSQSPSAGRKNSRSDGQWVNPFLSFGYFVFSSPFVIVCSHLCCIVSTCVSSPMATVCAPPPLLSDDLFAIHLFDLKQVPVCCVIFLHLFNC